MLFIFSLDYLPSPIGEWVKLVGQIILGIIGTAIVLSILKGLFADTLKSIRNEAPGEPVKGTLRVAGKFVLGLAAIAAMCVPMIIGEQYLKSLDEEVQNLIAWVFLGFLGVGLLGIFYSMARSSAIHENQNATLGDALKKFSKPAAWTVYVFGLCILYSKAVGGTLAIVLFWATLAGTIGLVQWISSKLSTRLVPEEPNEKYANEKPPTDDSKTRRFG